MATITVLGDMKRAPSAGERRAVDLRSGPGSVSGASQGRQQKGVDGGVDRCGDADRAAGSDDCAAERLQFETLPGGDVTLHRRCHLGLEPVDHA